MEKANPEIAKLSYVEKDLNSLQTRLLNYRLKTDNPPELGNDFILKGRTREIFESIVATAQHIGISTDDLIQYAKDRDRKEEEELKETDYYEILTIIKDFMENPNKLTDPDAIGTDDFIRALGWEDTPENRQKLGYDFKNLGLIIKRVGHQRYLFFEGLDNAKRLKQLYKRYKLIDRQTRLEGGLPC
jgi:hypothetical protein